MERKSGFPHRTGILALCLQALSPAWAATPPQLDSQGHEAYKAYGRAPEHKAFVIASGGTWAWRADLPTEDQAEAAALADCRAHTSQRCLTYALDQDVVLDEPNWWQAWGPYLAAAEAGRAAVGVKRGQRFPDLRLTDGKGRSLRLSDLRGRVVLAHFWGSWCPHCVREMPDLQKLHDRLAGKRNIAFVLLPVREPYAQAAQWLRRKRIRMPLYDGGASVTREHAFPLADGAKLPDREVARVFPSTYVLDKHGVVLFSHTGPVADWLEYLPQLLDAAARSGRP